MCTQLLQVATHLKHSIPLANGMMKFLQPALQQAQRVISNAQPAKSTLTQKAQKSPISQLPLIPMRMTLSTLTHKHQPAQSRVGMHTNTASVKDATTPQKSYCLLQSTHLQQQLKKTELNQHVLHRAHMTVLFTAQNVMQNFQEPRLNLDLMKTHTHGLRAQ